MFKLILGILASRFKARAILQAENLVLRQQVNALCRRTPTRPLLNNTDRFLFVIGEMIRANALWGAPRLGELLKLGIGSIRRECLDRSAPRRDG